MRKPTRLQAVGIAAAVLVLSPCVLFYSCSSVRIRWKVYRYAHGGSLPALAEAWDAPGGPEYILELARTDANLRFGAVTIGSGRGDMRVAPLIDDMIAHEDVGGRGLAVDSLAALVSHNPGATGRYLDLLESPERDLRIDAASRGGLTGSARVLEALEDRAAHDPDEEVRRLASLSARELRADLHLPPPAPAPTPR